MDAGGCYQGQGRKSTSAAKRLYDVVGLPLVKVDLSTYKHAWLLCAVLVWSFELLVVLPEEVSAAAFALADISGEDPC